MNVAMRLLPVAFGATASLLGCVDKGPGPKTKRIDPAYIAEHLLPSVPPTLTNRFDVAIGDFAVYLGNTIGPGPVTPGSQIRITHYWQVKKTPPSQWRVFSHLRGRDDTAAFYNADQTDMRLGHAPASWQPGEIIEDVAEITVPVTWKAKLAYLTVGMYQKGKHGIGDRAPIADNRATDHALTVATIAVDTSNAPPPPGTVHVRKAQEPIVIDGIAGEIAWAQALLSPEFATAEGSPDVAGSAQARMTWDDNNLYLFASVIDNDIFSEYKNQDDPLWKADCVEMFIDADGNKSGYIELQWNPNNARFDSWFATTRATPGDVSFDSAAISAVRVRGTADKSGDVDMGWDVEVAIPWQALRGKASSMNVRLPPQVGDRIKLNVVRVDKRGDTVTASSWNRITYSDFHALDRMLSVVFTATPGVPEGAAPVPPASPTPAATGSAVIAPMPAALVPGTPSAPSVPSVIAPTGVEPTKTGKMPSPRAGSAALDVTPVDPAALPRAIATPR